MREGMFGRAVVIGVMALSASVATVGAAQAAPLEPAVVLPVPFPHIGVNRTDPPGECTARERGAVKLDDHGVLHKCEYLPGEGWYWIPWLT